MKDDNSVFPVLLRHSLLGPSHPCCEGAQAARGEAHVEENLAPSPQAWLGSQLTDCQHQFASHEAEPFWK